MSSKTRRPLPPTSDMVNGERISGHIHDFDGADGSIILWPLKQMKTLHGTVERLYISSSDVTDVSLIQFAYIDANGLEVLGEATLSGQNFVDTGIDALFVNNGKVADGEDGVDGDVYIGRTLTGVLGVPTDTTKIEAFISAGANVTQQAAFYLPKNYTHGGTFLGSRIIVSGVANAVFGIEVKLRYQIEGGPIKTFEPLLLDSSVPYICVNPPFVEIIPPGTIMWVECNTNGTNNVHISGTFYIEKLKTSSPQ